MKDNIKVLLKEPGKPCKPLVIQNELRAMQFLVGGYIEHMTMWKGLGVLMDEEGKLKGLPENDLVIGGDPLRGNLIFVGEDMESGEFTDISDIDCETITGYMNTDCVNAVREKGGTQCS